MRYKFIISLCLLCFVFTGSYSQDYELGIMVSGAQYQGDLSKKPITWKETKLGLGALGRYNINPNLALKAAFNWGKIEGDDKNYISLDKTQADYYRYKRNLNFYSTIWEISVQGEYNFMRFISGSPRYRFTPYVFAGVSMFHYNPKTVLNGTVYQLKSFQTEPGKDYHSLSVSLPSGLGVKFSLGKLWNIGLEAGIRKTFTDYLDDVSDTYPNLAAVGAIDRALSDRSLEANPLFTGDRSNGPRGDANDKDTYVFMGLFITKTLRGHTCATFK